MLELHTSPEQGDTIKSPNKLAERMAMTRAVESRRPDEERICYDPYAIRFINPVFTEFALRNPDIFKAGMEQVNYSLPGVSNASAARVRYFDDPVIRSEDFRKMYFHGKNGDREVSGIYSFAYAVVE